MNPASTPSFCVVGQSNQGKTTLLATMTEDDRLGISNLPGTTTAATSYPVVVGNEEIMVFWDTPGFENTTKTYEWFQERADSSPNPAADFIEAFGDDPDFRMECEILRPISQGAAVVFIVDSSQRIRESDQQQIKILQLCRSHRLAVVYSKDGKGRHQNEWNQLLTRDFNIRVPFNSHAATVAERFRLLERIQTLIPEWEDTMGTAIDALSKDHDRRRSESVGHLLSALQRILSFRKSEPFAAEIPREEVSKRLVQSIEMAIRDEESRLRESIRKTFGHSKEHWSLPTLLSQDVFSENVWKVLGLTKPQLVAVGAVVGATIGAIVDAHLGGASFAVGTAFGTALGGSMAYFGAGRVAHLSYPKARLVPHSLRGKRFGGAQVVARVNPRSALFGILIDRSLLYIENAIGRPHGLPAGDLTNIRIPPAPSAKTETNSKSFPHIGSTVEDTADDPSPLQRVGLTSTWSASDQKVLAKYIGTAAKPHSDPIKLDDARSNLKRILLSQLSILTSPKGSSTQVRGGAP